MDTEKKRQLEMEVMKTIIGIYCRGHHHVNRCAASESEPSLCPDCRRLLTYARSRIAACPRMKVREVMRWSGPRMLLHHPLMTLHHMWIDYRSRRREKKELHS